MVSFKRPEVDPDSSINLVISLSKIGKNYVPNLKIDFPSDNDMNLNSILAIRDALELFYTKMDNMVTEELRKLREDREE